MLGFWGQKFIINDRNTFALEDLKKNGVKLYLLDIDDTVSNLTDCNALQLLDEYQQPLVVEGQTDRQVEDSIK